jgi:aryl-alcohol dehydrogenase-like predicted oxidoreductase
MVELLPEDFARFEDALVAALDGSLQRLARDSVDILIVHNPPRKEHDLSEPLWKPVTAEDMLGPAVSAFEKVRAAGKARFFGFASELSDPETVHTLLRSGQFSLMNVWYNVVNPSAARTLPSALAYSRAYPQYGRIIEEAQRNDVGVSAFRVLAGGALTERIIAGGPEARHPNAGGLYSREPQVFVPEIERSSAFSFLSEPDRSLPSAAYAYVLGNPGVTTAMCGFSDVDQMRQVLKAYPFRPLSDAELAQIEMVYESNFGLTTPQAGGKS